MPENAPANIEYLQATLRAAHLAREFLTWMEAACERLSPTRLDVLAREARDQFGNRIEKARDAVATLPPADGMESFAPRFTTGMNHTLQAFESFTGSDDLPFMARIGPLLAALHHLAAAQETFYLMRRALPPFEGYWLLPDQPCVDAAERSLGEVVSTGITHMTRGGHHGGFSLYVPETYTPDRDWPVIVALHGGSGNGRDFLWTWLREAKSCGYLLIAPKSHGDTWAEIDDRGLLEILGWVSHYYKVDRARILLTGLSDGATFGILYGLAHPTVYRAIAPLCGVLHPANGVVGNLERAAGVPIYLVHGSEDFLFPVTLARSARDTLQAAGADLTYREIEGLSHTYPRSENVSILSWFEQLPRSQTLSAGR